MAETPRATPQDFCSANLRSKTRTHAGHLALKYTAFNEGIALHLGEPQKFRTFGEATGCARSGEMVDGQNVPKAERVAAPSKKKGDSTVIQARPRGRGGVAEGPLRREKVDGQNVPKSDRARPAL